MPKYRHTARGTVVTTPRSPGPGWELADSKPTPKPQADEPKKTSTSTSTGVRKAAGKTTPKE